MKKAAWMILLAVVMLLAADCIVSYPTFGPPPLREEIIIGGPRPGYVWINGYWSWSGGNYHWVRGYWARARGGRAWVPGAWEHHEGRWHYRRGYWR